MIRFWRRSSLGGKSRRIIAAFSVNEGQEIQTMAVFVALNHADDTLQVNITMTDGAASGTWVRENTSSATLDFDNGFFLQTTYSGHPTGDRDLRNANREPLLVLRNFVEGTNSGDVVFAIEGGPGTFGTKPARWTRLEG
jgi:hypothetical protein